MPLAHGTLQPPCQHQRNIGRWGGILLGLSTAISCLPVPAQDSARPKTLEKTAVEARLKETVGYLASDELRGRSPGSKEIDLAADHIARRMKGIGLKTDPAHWQTHVVQSDSRAVGRL